MTIQRCREILQEEAEGLTDDDILEIIQQAGVLADTILDIELEKLKKKVN